MTEAFLDSHVALWLATGSRKLSPHLLSRFRAGACVLSSISIAEFEIKSMAGKIALPENYVRSFTSAGLAVVPFDSVAGSNIARLPTLTKHDPFDRLILAHAASRPNTTFFTADEQLVALGLDWVVDARL